MAITTNTFTINVGYGRSDVVKQLESAFTWLDWHEPTTVTGIVTGWTAYYHASSPQIDWNTLDNPWFYSEEATPITTTGIGTGLTLYVSKYRYNGGNQINEIYINNPGVGYTNGEYVTFAPGAFGPGTPGLGMTVTVSPVSYGGTTNSFYSKYLSTGSGINYGILKHKIQNNKKFGTTYRIFNCTSTTNLSFRSAADVHPYIFNDSPGQFHTHSGAVPRTAGVWGLDSAYYPTDSSGYLSGTAGSQSNLQISNGNSYQLDLNVFRSGIDPKFAVFSYKQPTLSSTSIRNNTFATFILHNFTTDMWNLDHVWLGGMTYFQFDYADTYARMILKTIPFGQANPQSNKRCAESGFDRFNRGIEQVFYANTPNTNLGVAYSSDSRLYYRNTTYDLPSNGTAQTNLARINSSANYNAVVKGIPINGHMLPVPYYMPEDFVILDFHYTSPSANIQQGDTITISGSEVYTVITGIYNQTTTTKGLLFCARTV